VAPAATILGWVWDKVDGHSPGRGGGIKPDGGEPTAAETPSETVTLPAMGSRTARGVLLLKGGDLKAELAETGRPYVSYDISEWFGEEFFETKKVVYIEKKR
jgi:hypothetical protein